MATPGERFKSWIDGLSEAWKDQLRGWMISWLEQGILTFMEGREPEIISLTTETLTKIKSMPNLPPELEHIIDKSLEEGQITTVIVGWLMTIAGSIMAVLSLGAPIGRTWEYAQDQAVQSARMTIEQIINAWYRDPVRYAWLKRDLDDLGWSEGRQEILKELAKIIPPLADMVRFADFSALDPEVIEQWREFYDAPGWIQEPFKLLGVVNEGDRDWANKYWFSHWRQPGRFELGEMYRRGFLGTPLVGQDEIGGAETEGEAENIVKLAYRTQGFSSFWQDNLLGLVREWPTRVDVRRWWDMRTITEERLRELYQGMGYFGKDLEDYVLWTKVYVAFPDLITRWKNGWITEDEVRAELLGLGMPAERVEEMIQTKIKAATPERTAGERELTKTDIVKGVKKGVITWEQGIELLQDIGYSEDEADYVLAINISALEGSPESFEEFKEITTKYKLATGREAKPMSDELRKAGIEVIKLTREVQTLDKAVEDEMGKFIDEEILPIEATAKLEELQVARNRALAELSRVKGVYSSLRAEWQHGRG